MNVLNKQSEKSKVVIDVASQRPRRIQLERERGTRDHGVKSEPTIGDEKSG